MRTFIGILLLYLFVSITNANVEIPKVTKLTELLKNAYKQCKSCETCNKTRNTTFHCDNDDDCFCLITEKIPRNWDEASALCKKNPPGSRLSVIHKSNRHHILSKILKQDSVEHSWIGLSIKESTEDSYAVSTHIWDDGQILNPVESYHRFYDDSQLTPRESRPRKCIYMKNDGKYGEADCDVLKHFSCIVPLASRTAIKIFEYGEPLSLPDMSNFHIDKTFQEELCNDHCAILVFEKFPMTWEEAATKSCISKVSRKKLIELNRELYPEFLKFINRVTEEYKDLEVWTGLTKETNETEWYWLDEHKERKQFDVPKSWWDAGEPKDYKTKTAVSITKDGKLRTWPHNEKELPFVCEILCIYSKYSSCRKAISTPSSEAPTIETTTPETPKLPISIDMMDPRQLNQCENEEIQSHNCTGTNQMCKCTTYIEEDYDWDTSKNLCGRINSEATLFSLNKIHMDDFFYLISHKKRAIKMDFWIGLTKRENEQWTWLDGSHFEDSDIQWISHPSSNGETTLCAALRWDTAISPKHQNSTTLVRMSCNFNGLPALCDFMLKDSELYRKDLLNLLRVGLSKTSGYLENEEQLPIANISRLNDLYEAQEFTDTYLHFSKLKTALNLTITGDMILSDINTTKNEMGDKIKNITTELQSVLEQYPALVSQFENSAEKNTTEIGKTVQQTLLLLRRLDLLRKTRGKDNDEGNEKYEDITIKYDNQWTTIYAGVAMLIALLVIFITGVSQSNVTEDDYE
ncbi:hypothetical protein QYM36_008750 [Artemia franciscana]|uniref:C-type lectin domain-containing protein n=1 Tax=Artemia franciscana TaxID=6661 RepID=A0AA88HUU2_ARTSF|nr:hypothetical protein QYM36_008750 [Artemia franciscana]